jgi:hypothetical protein
LFERIALRIGAFAFGAAALLFLVLAISEHGGESACNFDWTWFGCVLRKHDGLAGGLLGALVTLAAAWIAWSAVQQQIEASRLLALADRTDAKRLLSEDLAYVADGLGAVWRIVHRLGANDVEASRNARIAIMWAIERIVEPETTKARKQMVSALGWEDRCKFASLVSGIEALRPYAYDHKLGDFSELMDVIRRISLDFELCLPKTTPHFDGFPRGWPKAMSFGDLIRRNAGVEGLEGYGVSYFNEEG